MSDHWKAILEHLPLINVVGATAGAPKMIETKDLIGALLIGLLSAKGGSVMTTNELSAVMATKLEQYERQQSSLISEVRAMRDEGRAYQLVTTDKISRLEEKTASGSDRRPR